LDSINLPRPSIISDGRLGFASLRDVLTYTFRMKPDLQLRVTSAAGGILAGGLLLLTVWLVRRIQSAGDLLRYPAGLSAVAAFLLAGVLLPVSINLYENPASCSADFLANYEQAGKTLAEKIPPGSLVYWKGSGRHLALLLYAKDIRYFPPQITAGGGYYLGDSDQLLKRGMYNQELDLQWRESADFFIIWRFFPTIIFKDFQDQTKYQPIQLNLDRFRTCEEPLYLFKRIP
jgi:hypothetical protein